MKFFNITESPVKIYGLAVTDGKNGNFWRLPESILKEMPGLEYLGRRCTGGRARFCTDSAKIVIKMKLKEAKEDINFPTAGSAGADIYYGRGKASVYGGYIAPWSHSEDEISIEKEFVKTGQMDIVTVNLPRNDHLAGMEIGIEDGACMEAAPEYTISSPIMYYGSSITEGGCASRVGTSYTSIVSRWLDADYRNFGFSGNAKGEEVFARYISSQKNIKALVYDYDHNTPSVEHLAATHRRFFEILRQSHPRLPVLMMSRPDTDPYTKEVQALKDVVYHTYQTAREEGDENVYFLDGRQFFGTSGRAECTIDGCHPNALGFMRMAEVIYPVLEAICYPSSVPGGHSSDIFN